MILYQIMTVNKASDWLIHNLGTVRHYNDAKNETHTPRTVEWVQKRFVCFLVNNETKLAKRSKCRGN